MCYRHAVLAIGIAIIWPKIAVAAVVCAPKRECDVQPCVERHDTRVCGRDVGPPGLFHLNDPVCEAAKAAQNALYEADRARCEANNALKRAECERIKASEMAQCGALRLAEEAKIHPLAAPLTTATAAVRLGQLEKEVPISSLKAFTTEIYKGSQKLSERSRIEIEQSPEIAMAVVPPLRLTNPVLAGEVIAVLKAPCDAVGTLAALSTGPVAVAPVSGTGDIVPVAVDRFKAQENRIVTGCNGAGQGAVLADAVRSETGSYDFDVSISVFSIEGKVASDGRLHVQVRPGTSAYKYLRMHGLRKGQEVAFGGPVVWYSPADRNADSLSFLVVYPLDDLKLLN